MASGEFRCFIQYQLHEVSWRAPSEPVIVQCIVSGDALKLVHDTIFLKNVVHNVCYIEAGIRFVKRLKRQ